jgi:molybdopterin converting factor small subunit
MYPKPMRYTVEKNTTLREFISSLGEHTLYAYDRRVIGVVVNDKRLWDSAKLAPGDIVTIFPIIVGG